jgi:Tfp pilus assembly protein PilF
MGVAEALFPRDAELLSNIGDIHLQIGNRDKAVEYYKKALEIAPRFKAVQEKLSKLENRYR